MEATARKKRKKSDVTAESLGTVTASGQDRAEAAGRATSGIDALGEIDLQQQPPVVNSVVPNNVTTNGGKMVTIKGSNFRAGSTVMFGTDPADNVVFIDRQILTCIPRPHAAGNVKVRVTNQGSGLTGTLSMGFTYIQAPAPSLAGLFPNPIEASTFEREVTVGGANFAPGCQIIFGAAMGPAIYDNPNRVRFLAPALERGTNIGVGVQNPDGQRACCAILSYT
jgi:hypothetical protein